MARPHRIVVGHLVTCNETNTLDPDIADHLCLQQITVPVVLHPHPVHTDALAIINLSLESSPPSAHPHRSQNRETDYAHHRRSPPEESSTSGAPRNYSREGNATSGAHRRRSPLRASSPSRANYSHSRTLPHPHALPHRPHVPTAEHKETERVAMNTIIRPEDSALPPMAHTPAVEETTQNPPAVHSAAMHPG